MRPSFFLLVALAVLLSACSLDITDPNAATEDEALSTGDGLKATTVGLQQYYATEALTPVRLTTAVTAREVAIDNTLQNLVNLEEGGAALPNTNANVTRLWSRNYRVVGTAEDILDNLDGVTLPPEMKSGIQVTALLFKAMALGNVAQSFTHGARTVDRTDDATFVPRADVFTEAIRLLEAARTQLDALPPSDAFRADVLASGVDLRNTINARLARYHLFAGNDDAAITAANRVDPSATSTLPYDDLSQNPIWNDVNLSSQYAPRDAFGFADTDPADARLDFFLDASDATSNPNELPIETLRGFFAASTTSIPLYVPGEMPLIRAEAKLRRDDPVADVVAEIDAVRTKTAGDDALGIGADLPAYDGPTDDASLRAELLRQRRAELFLQGVALSDLRRLGPDIAAPVDPNDAFARTRNFYPFPAQERRSNPNTPDDPDV